MQNSKKFQSQLSIKNVTILKHKSRTVTNADRYLRTHDIGGKIVDRSSYERK